MWSLDELIPGLMNEELLEELRRSDELKNGHAIEDEDFAVELLIAVDEELTLAEDFAMLEDDFLTLEDEATTLLEDEGSSGATRLPRVLNSTWSSTIVMS